MESSVSSNTSTGKIYYSDVSATDSFYGWKTYGFIIAILSGIGGMAVAGAGLAGYLHVGALSNMAQINATIMLSVGGSGGAILFAAGIVVKLNNHPRKALSPKQRGGSESQKIPATPLSKPDDAQDLQVYGPEIWPKLGKMWNCDLKISDEKIPEAPAMGVRKGRVRIYIPGKIIVDGREKKFTLNALRDIKDVPIEFCGLDKKKGDWGAPQGWIEIDTAVIPGSRDKNYEDQKKIVEEAGDCVPTLLEAVVLNLVVFAFTKARPYGNRPCTYTRCSDQLPETCLPVVGNFSEKGLNIGSNYYATFQAEFVGIAGIKRFQN